MNWILTKYTVKNFVLIFLATLIILTLVVGLFDLIELLRQAAKGETAGFFDALTMAALKAPQMMHIILPFVVLLSGMIFCLIFNRSSELIVMRAVGLSIWNILSPLAIVVVLIGLLDTMVFSPVTAWTARRYERMEERLGFTHSTPMVWSEDGFLLREQVSEDGKTQVLRASQIIQEKKAVFLKNISVFELSNAGALIRQTEGTKASLSRGVLRVEDAFVLDPVAEKSTTVPVCEFETELSLDRILEKFDDPQTMSFWRFHRFIEFLKESGFSTAQHTMYYHELIAFPAFLLSMLLIAVAVTVSSGNRQGRTFIKVLLSIAMGFLLYFISRITNVLGLSGSLPYALAAWGPSLICIPLCLSALLHLEDG
ncbi:MAG: LptF/LptG family permease [Alphaproteobacteria bacterium]|nr:LptF/LptG family permease [Alphaproteobacteria bacterium]